MPWSPPRTVNIKPSRFGPIGHLFAAYDYCEERGIGAYGGGQTELGPGRGQIQYLASIFHPDTPNDIAPRGYNDPEQATAAGAADEPAGARDRRPRLPLRRLGRPAESGFRLRWWRASVPSFANPQGAIEMAEKSFAAALNEQVSNEFAAPQQYIARRRLLRLRNAAPPRRLLLPPGARGARARDDDDPVPARRRRDRDPRHQVGRRPPSPTAPSRCGWRSSRRSGSASRSSTSSRLARELKDYRAEQFLQWFIKEQVEEVALMGDLLKMVERAKDNPLLAEEYHRPREPRRGGLRPDRPARRRRGACSRRRLAGGRGPGGLSGIESRPCGGAPRCLSAPMAGCSSDCISAASRHSRRAPHGTPPHASARIRQDAAAAR